MKAGVLQGTFWVAALALGWTVMGASAHAEIATFRNGLNGYTGTEDVNITVQETVGGHSSDGEAGGYLVGANFGGPYHYVNRLLIRFDVSSLTGQFSSIDSVTLRLTRQFVDQFPTLTLHLPTAGNANWSESLVSWDYKDSAALTPWEGGQGLGDTGYAAMVVSGVVGTNPIDFTISDSTTATSVVNAFLGSNNPGFLIRQDNETGAGAVAFYSSETTFDTYQPTLIISYTPVPEAGPTLLIAIAAAGALARRRGRH